MGYPLCREVVTVYRKNGSGVFRQLISGCYFENSRVREENGLGFGWENRFLLIVPGETQGVFVGDKVYFGIGPEVNVEQWAQFCSANYEEVGEVAYATPYFRSGRLCHTEAGRK